MESIRLDIDNRQLQQMIGLFEKFQRFGYRLRMTNRTTLSSEDKAKMINTFNVLYSKYYGEDYSKYDPADLVKMESILEKMPTG
jgi:hypothetical protein